MLAGPPEVWMRLEGNREQSMSWSSNTGRLAAPLGDGSPLNREHSKVEVDCIWLLSLRPSGSREFWGESTGMLKL